MRSAWIVAGLVALIAAGAGVAARRPVVRQPIRFDHAKHIAAGSDCNSCHDGVDDQSFAGLPTLDTCLQCHDQPMSKDPEEKKVRDAAERKVEPAWQRVYRMPAHVYFSHRRHVTLAKVACAVCHGDVAQSHEPQPRPAVDQTMAWCLACHTQRHASTDCIACHR